MKFKYYVAMLQKTLEEKPETGEMEAIYAADDEGNAHYSIHYDEPAIGIYDGKYGGEFYNDEESIAELAEDGAVPNAVCIN